MGRMITNSKEVLDNLERIKSQKVRRYNKLGEWKRSGKTSPLTFDEKDLKYILR